MKCILVLSVLACLAAPPAFAWGTGAGTGASAGASVGTGNNGSTGDHGEADARGSLGGFNGEAEGMRWDDELGCIEGTLTRCNR